MALVSKIPKKIFVMQFTKFPLEFSSVDKPLVYGVKVDKPSMLDFRIIDRHSQKILGVRRFLSVTETDCDIAPYLEGVIGFSPRTGVTDLSTGEDRMVLVGVEVTVVEGGPGDGGKVLRAPDRWYMHADREFEPGRLISTMPRVRMIDREAGEELTLWMEQGQKVMMAFEYRNRRMTKNFTAPRQGVWVLKIAPWNYPGVELVSIDTGRGEKMECTVADTPQGSVTLAWRSSMGSVEHYTFPQQVGACFEVEGKEEPRVRSRMKRTLRSACERREVLEALAEVAASPEVWVCEQRDLYRRVEVVSHGVTWPEGDGLKCLEIDVVLDQNDRKSWN